MRVAFFTCHNDPGVAGLYYFERAIIGALEAFSIDFEFVNIHRGKAPTSTIKTIEIPIPKSPESGRADLKNALIKNKIDLVWFLGSFERCEWPYVFTTLDLAHRRFPEFPETSVFGWPYEEREIFYTQAFSKASGVIVGTEFGGSEVTQFYGKLSDQVHVLPFFPPPFLDKEQQVDVGKDPFFLFPAQFWPHKNHKVLVDAMKILSAREKKCNVIFIGSDRGNQKYIEDEIRKADLKERIKLLGFVSRIELRWLYKNARALVFPTYFGPDNLPPLEAFLLKCPVIASAIPGCQDQLGNAAILCEPDDAKSWADAMANLLQDSLERENLTKLGSEQLKERNATRYVAGINQILKKLSLRRACWGSQEAFISQK